MEWETVIVAAIGIVGILVTQWIINRREVKRLTLEESARRSSFLLERRIGAYSDFLTGLNAAGSERYKIMKLRVVEGRYESSDPSDVRNRDSQVNAMFRAYNMVCLLGSAEAVLIALDLVKAFEDSNTRDVEGWYRRLDALGKRFASTIRIELDAKVDPST